MRRSILALVSLTVACPGSDDDDSATPREPTPMRAGSVELPVFVTLDGVPTGSVRVQQGGVPGFALTGADGRATLPVDLSIEGDLYVIASHPEARQWGTGVPEGAGFDADGDGEPDVPDVAIELVRFDPSDNEAYEFRHPGTPDNRGGTDECRHCHVTMYEAWTASPHRTAASNPHVDALYAGTAAFDAVACAEVSGSMRTGTAPGTGDPMEACYLGEGVLPALNPGCDGTVPCDASGLATAFGGCADCHAPGIDGVLGGRDLREARGIAYEQGVHCDVCHHVESIDLDAPAGVAGRLRLLRPSEPLSGPLGPFQPLTFGPFHDAPQIPMGSVQRDHFREARFCAGCHELMQQALVPGTALDAARWPDGVLPIHTTYSEWATGPMNPAAPCQSCHMPPDPLAENAADLQLVHGAGIGFVTGWPRPPGDVRAHSFIGPRQPAGMLELAAALFIDKEIDEDTLIARVTTRNVGPGHAIPTGEPLRSLILRVRARCGDAELAPTGGDVVPTWGGARGVKDAGEDWMVWPGASVGQVVRVLRRPGGFVEYEGFGPFGDRFSAAEKGMPQEEYVGASRIIGVDGAGVVTFDRGLPAGDVAVLGDEEGDAAALAGAPGWAFARVLADRAGNTMVPHYLAVDVRSDNRLLPQQGWTSQHRFEAPCADPVVEATLLHRAFPIALAAERGWVVADSTMLTVSR